MRSLPLVMGMLCLAGAAHASTATVGADITGTPLLIFGVTSFTITGSNMVGLMVNVHFSDASSSGPVAWASTGATSGQATGSVAGGGSWTLSESGDTGFVSDSTNVNGSPLFPWTLTNTSILLGITSIDLLGGPTNGNLIFDRNLSTVGTPIVGLQAGTPGSSIGVTFSNTSINTPPADSGNYTVAATYSNIVQFAGASQNCQGAGFTPKTTFPPSGGCGDTWQGLTLTFSGTSFIGTGTPATFHFFQDTDMIGTPEPLTFGLMGAGLLAMVAYQRRRIARRAS